MGKSGGTTMTQEEIKEAIEDLDEEVLYTIIDCCKEFSIKGIQMCFWDRYNLMDVIDKVLEEQQ